MLEQVLRGASVAEEPHHFAACATTKWVAAEIIVEENLVRELIPRLKRAGASGIVEYPLNKVIY